LMRGHSSTVGVMPLTISNVRFVPIGYIMTMMRRIKVTAAILAREGKILIAQRKPGEYLAARWEFPGGKLEAGESATDCLVRELREELGIEAEIGELVSVAKHDYPHILIELMVYKARHLSGRARAIDHAAIKWLEPGELAGYEFLEADKPIVQRLISGELKP